MWHSTLLPFPVNLESEVPDFCFVFLAFLGPHQHDTTLSSVFSRGIRW